MSKFIIRGKKPLQGVLKVNGSKNAALPIFCATLLAQGEYILHNVPNLRDIETVSKLLQAFGLQIEKVGEHDYKIINHGINNVEAPYDLVSIMRASFLVMGPLLASQKKAKVSLPGGCAIGARPVNYHLAGFEKLGAKVTMDHGFITAEADELIGSEINFPGVTVTGTENVVMAAVMAKGKTIINNAALEPEVGDLCEMLNKMGAKITGIGTAKLEIEGVEKLQACEHMIIPDRIEAGTFLILSALTNGAVAVKNVVLSHLTGFLNILEKIGLKIEAENDLVRVQQINLKAIEVVTTPYPGFPTDLQAQLLVLLSQADGESKITETIFENRFMHVAELNRMGGKIEINSNTAKITGPTSFVGAEVKATDLRAGACLVLAGLIAENTTTIDDIHHIERGYEDLVGRLQSVGAEIERLA